MCDVCVCGIQGYERVRRVSEEDLSPSMLHDEEEGLGDHMPGRDGGSKQVVFPNLLSGLTCIPILSFGTRYQCPQS